MTDAMPNRDVQLSSTSGTPARLDESRRSTQPALPPAVGPPDEQETKREPAQESGVPGGPGQEQAQQPDEEWTYPDGGLKAWGVVLVRSLSSCVDWFAGRPLSEPSRVARSPGQASREGRAQTSLARLQQHSR